MSTAQVVVVASVLSAAVSFGVSKSIAPEPQQAVDVDGLQASLEAIERQQSELANQLAALRAKGDTASPLVSTGRVPVGEIEAAVRRFLESHSATVDASSETIVPEPAEKVAGLVVADASVEDLLAQLLDDDLDDLKREELWQAVREAGRIDELIEHLEAAAEAAPGDTEAQLDLGVAYLQKIQEVGAGPLAGVLADKADGAFDQALTVDPEHWEARFHKAVALSFWPPVFGKQNESIQQFEILIEQQAGTTPQGHHAQTHLLLGNMYQQIGNTEKALAAWQQGLQMFPNNEALLAQVELVGD
ncbi:MAG: hypothetical protein GY711_02120 [bacterium]|nr:hypothetical protein [bacterium]